MVSFYITGALVWGLNSPNESYWHGDYNIMSHCYKSEIISGAVGIGSLGGGQKIQKGGGK